MEINEENTMKKVDIIINNGVMQRQKYEDSEYLFFGAKFCFSNPDKPQTISIEGNIKDDCNLVFTNSNDYSLFNEKFVDASKSTYNQDIKVLDYNGDVIGRYPKGRTNNFAGNVTFNKPTIFSLEKLNFDNIIDSDRITVIFIRDIGIYKKIKVAKNLSDYLKDSIDSIDRELIARNIKDKVKFVINNPFLEKVFETNSIIMDNIHFISNSEIISNDILYFIEYCFGCDVTEEKSLLNTFLKYDSDNFDYLFSHSKSESRLTDRLTVNGYQLVRDQRGPVRSQESIMTSCVTGRRNGRIEFKCADGETFDIVMVFSIKEQCPADYKFKLWFENDSNIFKVDGGEFVDFVPKQWIILEIDERSTFLTSTYIKIWNLFFKDKHMKNIDTEEGKHSTDETLEKHASDFMFVLISKNLRDIINESEDNDTMTSSYVDLLVNMCLIMRSNILQLFERSINDMFSTNLKNKQQNKKKRGNISFSEIPTYEENSYTHLMGRACSSYVGNVTSLGCS